jgi:Tol biopolymer transport system component
MPARHPLYRMLTVGQIAPIAALVLAGCGAQDPVSPAETGAPVDMASETDVAPASTGDLAALVTTRIVFTSYRYKDVPNIFTMDASGSNVTRLTSWTEYSISPVFSYDNKKIAFQHDRLDATTGRHAEIFIMNADGSNKHWARPAISDFSMSDPAWAPDGTNLLVSVSAPGWNATYIARLTLATGVLEFLSLPAGGPVGSEASYDPTGKKVMYVGPTGRSIERMNADGTGHVTVMSSATEQFSTPRYSPDGKRILFGRSVGGNEEVFVKNADGSVKRLTNSPGVDESASWSADGNRITFTSERSGEAEIWTMSSNGGAATRVTHSSFIDTTPAYSH